MMTAEGLGRYEIVEELGRGAMGVVYLAQDPALGRLVAVKALNGHLDNAKNGDSSSFLREARTAGSLDHPGIVTVHDADDGERPFIAMEYVQGTDLKEVLRPGKPLPDDFVIKVTEQVAEALDYAHARGVVHRDIKPGNILITTNETVKLTDFGIASAPTVAESSERLGTPHYVAPEQLRGEAVDGRADVFALGVVVYEMLTGKRPFEDPDLKEVVRRLANEPFTPPSQHGITLRAPTLKVLQRAMAKSPGDRLASAGALARALRAAFEGRQEATTRDLSDLLPEPPPPPVQPVRRRRPLLWVAASLATLLAAASGWGLAQKTFETPAPETSAAPLFRLNPAHAELVRQAEELLAAGDAITAARLLGLAVEMAPHRTEVGRMHAEAVSQAEAQRAVLWRDGTVERLLLEAQQAQRQGRYSQAVRALRQAAELDPEQPAVQELLGRIESARSRYRASQEQASPEPTVAPLVPEFVPPAAPPVSPPEQPLPDWSDLRIDLFSQVPRGVVTVYAAGDQVMNQSFRFGKRAGLLRKKTGAGRLEAKRRLPAGDTELRVYVTLPGRAATRRTLNVSLPAGASRALRILIDTNGEPSVQLD
jgi:tRNA A-37 threonylcarbamoyl transferase component Bud32/tetratricopeptide (TPR) repeat protein